MSTMSCNGTHLPAGNLLQAPTLQPPSTRTTIDPSLYGIDTLATGNLPQAPTIRRGQSLEKTSSSGEVAAQESTASLLCGPLLVGSQLPPISKFSGEEQDGEGEGFEEWIE